MKRRAIFASAILCVACEPDADVGSDIEAQELSGAWVFSYAEEPTVIMDALGGGQAAVVDGCLQVDDSVFIWYEHHLDTVEEIIGRIDKGEKVVVRIGGGGFSVDEGSTVDDFPESVREHCSPTAIWYTSPDEIELGKEG